MVEGRFLVEARRQGGEPQFRYFRGKVTAVAWPRQPFDDLRPWPLVRAIHTTERIYAFLPCMLRAFFTAEKIIPYPRAKHTTERVLQMVDSRVCHAHM